MTEYTLADGAARMARIAAEASSSDSGVRAPDRAWAGSSVSNLVALEEGMTYIRNKEMRNLPENPDERAAVINQAKSDIRKASASSIARAKGITGGARYTTESAVLCTDSGRLFACVFITRLGDATDEGDDL